MGNPNMTPHLNIHHSVLSHNLYFDTLLSSIGKDKQIYE